MGFKNGIWMVSCLVRFFLGCFTAKTARSAVLFPFFSLDVFGDSVLGKFLVS